MGIIGILRITCLYGFQTNNPSPNERDMPEPDDTPEPEKDKITVEMTVNGKTYSGTLTEK